MSTITLWELALLAERGRIKSQVPLGPWLDSIERDERLFFYPINAKIAADAASMPRSFPGDPADRLITATARCEDLELVTADERIRDSGLVKVV